MQKLVKQGVVVDNDWTVVAKGEAIPETGKVLVNAEDFNTNIDALLARGAGVWLDSDQAPALIEADLNKLSVIAINFPAFADGRGYSYAYILRKELAYTGELRAIGDVLRDQMFYMSRCGFDTYAVREDRDAADSIASLSDFSQAYQAAVDTPSPLMVKRWS